MIQSPRDIIECSIWVTPFRRYAAISGDLLYDSDNPLRPYVRYHLDGTSTYFLQCVPGLIETIEAHAESQGILIRWRELPAPRFEDAYWRKITAGISDYRF